MSGRTGGGADVNDRAVEALEQRLAVLEGLLDSIAIEALEQGLYIRVSIDGEAISAWRQRGPIRERLPALRIVAYDKGFKEAKRQPGLAEHDVPILRSLGAGVLPLGSGDYE